MNDGTLASGVTNWPLKFDGILFCAWGPTQGHKVRHLLVAWGRLKSFFFSFSLDSLCKVGLSGTIRGLFMLLQNSSAKLADTLYNYHDIDEITNKFSPWPEVGMTKYPFSFTTQHSKNWLSVSSSQYPCNFDPLVTNLWFFLNIFMGILCLEYSKSYLH
jgi:hypothetical protein